MKKLIILSLIFTLVLSTALMEEASQSNIISPDNQIQLITEKKVTIFIDREPIMYVGQTVHLTSKLEGFEDCTEIIYQWQVDKNDEYGWQEVKDGNKDHYEFAASAETLSWSWRLVVYYK